MKQTILIVDDMIINIEALINVLRGKYKLMVATSGKQAIELMKEKKPDMVLLDVYMPEISGFDVLQFMKSCKDLESIPVIFVTGENEVNVEEKGLSLGAVDYIKKPFVGTIIDVKVKNHLELKEHRDNLESLVCERTKQLKASRDAIIMGMSLMSERHDNVTGKHIERIRLFTKILTDKMLEVHPDVIQADLANLIVLYSPLHDVGKIGVSDVILKKTGILTPDEFEIMKGHTVEGAELLHRIADLLAEEDSESNLKVAIEIAECHHEKFDGTGYPHGLSGEDIPLSARIVAIADAYDALRSPRQYKRAFTHRETMDIILHGDGRTSPTHFDSIILDVFRLVESEFDKAYK